MAKKIIKVTPKYLEAVGLKDMQEELKDTCVKRYYYESDMDEVLPHDSNQYSLGVVSSIDIDSDGDVVIPKGIDISRYEKNPVVLFNHSLSEPIGYAEQLQIQDDKIIAKTRFGTTPEAQRIHQLVKDKVLRTHSIGFIVQEAVVKGEKGFNNLVMNIKNQFPEKFQPEDLNRINRIVTKALLIEYSIVTVPANENAVISEIKALKEDVEEAFPETEEVDEETVFEEIPLDLDKKDIETEEEEEKIETKEVEEEEVITKSEDEPIEQEPQVETEENIEVKAEVKTPTIKVIKRHSKIKKVSSKKDKETEQMKKIYKSLWGV